MNIGKLGIGSYFNPDKCNRAKKTRHIVVEEVCESTEALCKDESSDIRF